MECAICIEKYNKTYRKKITCLYCDHQTCSSCVERYLIDNTIIPKCMNCKREWNIEFLRTMLSRTFMEKKYKEHQKDALLSEAESTIGQYQVFARLAEEAEHASKIVAEAKAEMDVATKKYRDACDELYRIRGQYHNRPVDNTSERRDFFMACPRVDCRGKLSNVYKCGLCEHWFCPQCHVDKGMEKDGEHECHQDDLDTVKLLRDNTRPCPKCHMGIYKTEGCDQMWCVQCQTCFSWRSGSILNGVVHNPHFYEYQRRLANGGDAPRVPGDIPCGGLPPYYQMRNLIRSRGGDTITTSYLCNIHQYTNELIDVVMPSIYRKFNARPDLHRQHGVQYLRNFINREKWRDLIYKAVRQEEKYRRYYQLLETITTNIAEYLRQFIAGEDPKKVKEACDELFKYANEESDKLRKQYNMTLPKLSYTSRV